MSLGYHLRMGCTVLLLTLVGSGSSSSRDEEDLEWLRWVLIDVLPTMRNDSARSIARLAGATDTIEWYQGMQANRGDQMRRRGIATSGPEQYEYEESLQFSTAEIWSHFGQNGVAMNESVLPPPGGFGGKLTMTSVAPKWAEQVRQGLLRPSLFGDAVTQDNVGAPLYGPANGCCDVRSNALFLQLHGKQLRLPGNFSMGAYITSLRRKGLSGVALVQDRVIREVSDCLLRLHRFMVKIHFTGSMVQIIRFHFVENLQRWRATYRAIKADAAENGRPTPAVYGNVHIVENAYSVIVSQYLDVVWTETPAFFPRVGNPTWGSPASGFSALQYKLGQSCGNFSKPHWGIVTLTGCGLAPTGFKPQDGKPQIMTSVLAAAEAVANGASAAMLVGDTVSADECLPAAQRWASFVDRHRHLFGPERHREADVVILCFPISFYLRALGADCLL